MKTWKILLFIALFLVLMFVGYVYTLQNIKITDVSVYKLTEISTEGFTLTGHVEVHNGGIFPVGVDDITYNVLVGDRLLADGIVEGAYVMPGKSAKFALRNRVQWQPTAEAALQLLEPGDTYAQVRGTVMVNLLGYKVRLPFVKEFNIEEYLRAFVVEKVAGWLEKAKGFVQALV